MRLGILKSHKSCISNSKLEISEWTAQTPQAGESDLRFRVSNLRCRIRPISKFPDFPSIPGVPLFLSPQTYITQESASATVLDVLKLEQQSIGISEVQFGRAAFGTATIRHAKRDV